MDTECQFLVIIPVFNMEAWIGENIAVLKNQSYRNFRCFIGDDLSSDNSAEIIEKAIDGDSRFTLIRHTTKKFSLGNICTLIDCANAEDEEVVVLIDGDDCLAHENVLKKLTEVYRTENCWLTYGSYANINSHKLDTICLPYPQIVVKYNRFRDVKWRASHLKTFKYKLWKQVHPASLTISAAELKKAKLRALLKGHWRNWRNWRNIQLQELVDPSGRFTRRCSDKAITSPLLEMAGERAVFVPDVLYYYRVYETTPAFGTAKHKQKWYQRLTRNIIQHKDRYRRLSSP
jgi:glycosyltransferase involved in cell wall biosynthesis